MEDAPNPADWILLGFCCLVGPLALCIARVVLPDRRRLPQPTTISSPLTDPKDRLRHEGSDAQQSSVSCDDIGSVENHIRSSTSQIFSEPVTSEGNGEAGAVSTKKRIVYYDFWRTLCICLVVLTHWDETYVKWNTLATQNWVLPFFSIISGALYAKASKSPLFGYVARLLMFFSIGATLNGGAVVLRGVHWWGGEFEMVVIFQTAFVILFVIRAIVSRPLKAQFDNQENLKIAEFNVCMYSGVVVGAIVSLECMDTGAFSQTIRVTAECFTTTLIVALVMWVLPKSHRGLLGWILLAWVYGTRVLFMETRLGSDLHFVDLYIWAFVVEHVPLAGQTRVGQIMLQTWPIWFVAVILLLTPGTNGRKDMRPFETIVERARFFQAELVFVLAFTVIPKAEQPVAQFTEQQAKHMEWLNWWSMFAFLSHKAIYYLYDPYTFHGMCLVFATMPFFYLAFGPNAKQVSCLAKLSQSPQIVDIESGISPSPLPSFFQDTELALVLEA